MDEKKKTEEELIDEAMAALDREPLPTTTVQDLSAVQIMALPQATPSPTLAALAPSLRPKTEIVCERCPASLWFASPVEVKCYCRMMYLVVWSSAEPNEIMLCDGPSRVPLAN